MLAGYAPTLIQSKARIERQEKEVPLTVGELVDGLLPSREARFLKHPSTGLGALRHRTEDGQLREGRCELDAVNRVDVLQHCTEDATSQLDKCSPLALRELLAVSKERRQLQIRDRAIKPVCEVCSEDRVISPLLDALTFLAAQ